MITNLTTPRRCKFCQQEKPLTEFYKSGKYYAWKCKDCCKQDSKRQIKVDRKVSTVPTERDVIHELHKRGIPALPGKALGYQYADVVAWGCVLIEVKSTKWNGHDFGFGFSSQRIRGRIRGQLIVLVCQYDDHQTYHLFDARNPVFYKDGKIKYMVQYIPNPKQTKGQRSSNTLSDEMMEAAEDQWQMIEQWRLILSDQLRETEALSKAV